MRTLVFLSLLILISGPAFALDTKADQAFIFDLETGTVLLDKDADARMPTSSMSKVMTMYMVFDALEDGTITLDNTMQVSEKAWRKGGSKMFVEVGKDVRVEDLIKGVIVQSGNDATIVLAEGLMGSEERFAVAMTDTAVSELGMVNSNFTNASGWPDPDHYSTAKDLGRLAAAIITRFPQYYDYYAIREFTFNNIRQANRNPLLGLNLGADGIKTGHTEAAGYGLMASGQRGNRRVVMVLNGMESESERREESARLLDWALGRFENIALFSESKALSRIPVSSGVSPDVAVRAEKGIKLTIPKGARDDIAMQLRVNSPVPAPIQEGDILGVVEVSIPDQPMRSISVIAAETVAKAGFFKRLGDNLIQFIEQQTGG